jgi:hypothetical protein
MKKTCYKLPEEVEAAKTDAEKYEFVYIRELSRLEMGRRTDLEPINWNEENEVIEVRFFDDKSELRFFKQDGNLRAALIEDDGGKEGIDFKTSDKIDLLHDGKFGKSIIVREYFDYDADGQIFVTASRLVEWR